MSEWIRSIAAAAILSAVALAVVPGGRVKEVTRFVCGVLCALAVASPIAELDIGDLAAGMAAYGDRAAELRADAEEEAKMLNRSYIEEKYGAYILGKAAEAGVDMASAAVTARWDDSGLLWYPWQAELDADYDAALSSVIEAELGIPRTRQNWRGDGQ